MFHCLFSASIHYLNRWWLFVNLSTRNRLKLFFFRISNPNILIQENAFDNVICKMGLILPRPQCVENRCRLVTYSWTNIQFNSNLARPHHRTYLHDHDLHAKCLLFGHKTADSDVEFVIESRFVIMRQLSPSYSQLRLLSSPISEYSTYRNWVVMPSWDFVTTTD